MAKFGSFKYLCISYQGEAAGMQYFSFKLPECIKLWQSVALDIRNGEDLFKY